MDAIALAASVARRFEGFYPSPYLCPAGVPSIGYGSTHYEDGTAVTLFDAPITRERAEALLQFEMQRVCARAVRSLCPGVDTQGRAAALMDFTYNLGAGRLRASTLRRRVNAGEWGRVPQELRKWVKGGGRVLAGLVRRREAEVALLDVKGPAP
ncbi:MAG TPA: lysozyme [Aquabacterium sp.]|nr:lysozyme [Aquabacterium sp.]